MTKTDLINPQMYAVRQSRMTTDRKAVGDTFEEGGREWTVLRSNYVGDGLYTQLLGSCFSFPNFAGSELLQ